MNQNDPLQTIKELEGMGFGRGAACLINNLVVRIEKLEAKVRELEQRNEREDDYQAEQNELL